MPKRILVLSADFGAGHLAAANAIAAACQQLYPSTTAEPLQLQSPILNLFTAIYLFIIKRFPALYRRLYRLRTGWLFRAFLVTTLGWSVQRAIRQHQPDLIIGTHPFPAGVAAYLRHMGHLKVPVIMSLTDFHSHDLWIWKGVDHYFTASEQVAEGLIKAGVSPDRISVTGVAIRPAFAEAHEAVQRRWEPSEKRQVLVMGGGLGLGPIVEAVRSLAALPNQELTITVVCGRNAALRAEAQDLFDGDPRIRIVGFTHQVLELMMESDLLITKPGGITCSEAMAVGLPMLLLSPLPGHEEQNATYLTEIGVAQVTDGAWVGTQAAELLFHQPDQLRKMREAAFQRSYPQAAESIATGLVPVAVQKLSLSTNVG